MIYWVGTITNRFSAIWSNSAVRFGRLVVYFRPVGFYLFSRQFGPSGPGSFRIVYTKIDFHLWTFIFGKQYLELLFTCITQAPHEIEWSSPPHICHVFKIKQKLLTFLSNFSRLSFKLFLRKCHHCSEKSWQRSSKINKLVAKIFVKIKFNIHIIILKVYDEVVILFILQIDLIKHILSNMLCSNVLQANYWIIYLGLIEEVSVVE